MRTFVAATAVLVTFAIRAPATAAPYLVADETRVHALVNQARGARALAPLARNSALDAMARGQSDRMAARGSLFHNPSLGAEAARRGLDWSRIGENVGYGPDVAAVQTAFLQSPAHLANIVEPRYNALGVGVVEGREGWHYVTQVFASLRSVAQAAPRARVPRPAAVTPPSPRPEVAPSRPEPRTATPARPEPARRERTAQPRQGAEYDNAVTGGVIRPLPTPLLEALANPV